MKNIKNNKAFLNKSEIILKNGACIQQVWLLKRKQIKLK